MCSMPSLSALMGFVTMRERNMTVSMMATAAPSSQNSICRRMNMSLP